MIFVVYNCLKVDIVIWIGLEQIGWLGQRFKKKEKMFGMVGGWKDKSCFF